MSNDKIIEEYYKMSLKRQQSDDSLLLNNNNDERSTGLDPNNDNQEKDFIINNDLFTENQIFKRIDENNLFYKHFENNSKDELKIEKIFQTENKDEQIDLINSDKLYFISNQSEKKKKKKNKKLGRKRKNEDRQGSNHTKEKKDNIINKIKGYFFKYVNDTINKSLTKECLLKFQKVPHKMIIKSKRDYNLNLLNSPLRQVYQETTNYIERFKKYKRRDYSINKILLEYLEKNKEKEKKAFDLLNKNVSLIFDDFRKTNMQIFLNTLRDKYKEEQNHDNIEHYLQEVQNLCNNFEKYYINRKSRKNGKKMKYEY